jgi:hypothetical protein
MLGLIILIYVLGFFTSLMVLHIFKNELDVNHYNPPHPAYYDDYNSNAEAFVSFSLIWPIFWFLNMLRCMWKGLVWISTQFEKNKNN